MRAGVVVVSHHSATDLSELLPAITHPDIDVVVVDSGSSDDSGVAITLVGVALLSGVLPALHGLLHRDLVSVREALRCTSRALSAQRPAVLPPAS